ncbi:MAG TPA: UPF0182 family protein, partial [Blastocatellia bacterium]|nr:UPF0182 family protein [Blastocatellia bacterium]
PIADSLIYVEAFYLQSSGSTSKLPELRQVAIATQDRLAAGKTFDEALSLLFPGWESGQASQPPRPGAPPTEAQAQSQAAQPTQAPPPGTPSAPGTSADAESQRLAHQALQLISEYERLSAAGKHREAGEKLDQLKQTLDQLNRKRGG